MKRIKITVKLQDPAVCRAAESFGGVFPKRHIASGLLHRKPAGISGSVAGRAAGRAYLSSADGDTCLFWFDENRFHGAGGTSYVLSGDEEIWDLARKIQETYPEYREAME